MSFTTAQELTSFLRMTRKEAPVDLLITHVQLLNIYSGELKETSVAIGA